MWVGGLKMDGACQTSGHRRNVFYVCTTTTHRQTHIGSATTAPAAPVTVSLSLSSEDSDGGDEDSGYERDLDLTPNLPRWKRRRRQRIHTVLKPYAKKKSFGASTSSRSVRALTSLSARENHPGLANADVGGAAAMVETPDERRQRMAQVGERAVGGMVDHLWIVQMP